jgi:hypothetical protein
VWFRRRVERQIEPDPVAELDAVDRRALRIAACGVKASRSNDRTRNPTPGRSAGCRDRRRRGAEQDAARFLPGQLDGRRDECTPDAAATVGSEDRHVLDLGRARQGRFGELELPHDLVALEADEDVAVVEVGVQLRGRVLGEREQRP